MIPTSSESLSQLYAAVIFLVCVARARATTSLEAIQVQECKEHRKRVCEH